MQSFNSHPFFLSWQSVCNVGNFILGINDEVVRVSVVVAAIFNFSVVKYVVATNEKFLKIISIVGY